MSKNSSFGSESYEDNEDLPLELQVQFSTGTSLNFSFDQQQGYFLNRDLVEANITDPTKSITDNYRLWESGEGLEVACHGKGPTTLFSDPDPALYFWAIENFSNPDLKLDQEILYKHILHASKVTMELATSALMQGDEKALECGWYFFCFLLNIQENLANLTSSEANHLLDQHKQLVADLFYTLISVLEEHKDHTNITINSMFHYYEEKFISLAKSHPHLKKFIVPFLSEDNWRQMEERGSTLQELLNDKFYEEAESEKYDIEDFQTWLKNLSKNVIEDRDAANLLAKQLNTVTAAMMPQPDTHEDFTWKYPMEYLEKMTSGKSAIFLERFDTLYTQSDIADGERFMLDFLERTANHGFKNWIFTESDLMGPELYRMCIWLKQNNDHRSMHTVWQTIRDYMKLKRNGSTPSLRQYLLLPDVKEPKDATYFINYWQAVWDAKESVGAKVLFASERFENLYEEEALECLKSLNGEKFIDIGGKLIGPAFSAGLATKDKTLTLSHRQAYPDLDDDRFTCWRAASVAGYRVGCKHEWGLHQSAAVPLKGNKRLLAAFNEAEILGSPKETDQKYYFDVNNIGFMRDLPEEIGCVDAIIFTTKNESDSEDEAWNPSLVDETEPLVIV